MALYAFDGTWNTDKSKEDPQYQNTNVVRFYNAYTKNSTTKAFDYYRPGVGTRFDLAGKVLGGVFGLGEMPRIDEAYDSLCQAWAAGDHIIDVVGFSRGAATTLDFCHRVLEDGIRQPGSDTVVEPNPEIRFLGVWEVVGAFGLASLGNTALDLGHHLSLPKANLRYCFHALALDERRLSFLPTRLPGACEVWFRGAHSDIGGGNENRGLNDIALTWMMRKAQAAGLPIIDDDIAALRPDPTALPHPAISLPFGVRVVAAVDRRHYSVAPLAGWTTPPATCPVETATDEQTANAIGVMGIEVQPIEVQRRIAAMWEAAADTAKQLNVPLTESRDALLTLFQGRISLVTNDAQLSQACNAVARLVSTAIDGARQRGFTNGLPEFFLNEALFKLPRLFPLTD
jgi:hypothetical protein